MLVAVLVVVGLSWLMRMETGIYTAGGESVKPV